MEKLTDQERTNIVNRVLNEEYFKWENQLFPKLTYNSKYKTAYVWANESSYPSFVKYPADSKRGYKVIIDNELKFKIDFEFSYKLGNTYKGWLVQNYSINGVTYKYPYIVENFREYLKLLREILVNNCKTYKEKTEGKSFNINSISSVNIYLTKINHITNYLGDNYELQLGVPLNIQLKQEIKEELNDITNDERYLNLITEIIYKISKEDSTDLDMLTKKIKRNTKG